MPGSSSVGLWSSDTHTKIRFDNLSILDSISLFSYILALFCHEKFMQLLFPCPNIAAIWFWTVQNGLCSTNCFGKVQFVLNGSKSFRPNLVLTGPNHEYMSRKISSELVQMIFNQPKQFGRSKIILDLYLEGQGIM